MHHLTLQQDKSKPLIATIFPQDIPMVYPGRTSLLTIT
jgi:hypothetical protein